MLHGEHPFPERKEAVPTLRTTMAGGTGLTPVSEEINTAESVETSRAESKTEAATNASKSVTGSTHLQHLIDVEPLLDDLLHLVHVRGPQAQAVLPLLPAQAHCDGDPVPELAVRRRERRLGRRRHERLAVQPPLGLRVVHQNRCRNRDLRLRPTRAQLMSCGAESQLHAHQWCWPR